MKKTIKKPKKALAATKSKKVAPATKKPAKPVKPAPKVVAKAPEKKPEVKAKAAPAPVVAKKAAPPAPVKKDDKKAAPVPAPVMTKAGMKKEVESKVASSSKKGDSAAAKASLTQQGATKAPLPLKVEPKIIETTQPEYVKPSTAMGALFNEEELEQFRGLLETERNKILAKARRTMEDGNIQIDKNEMMDEVDQASAMVEQNLTFRLLDRDRKLLSEIDHALNKLEGGDYGYCEGTGEAIPKRRLELRPWCRHSVKYKEKLERMKKSGRGVVDEDEL